MNFYMLVEGKSTEMKVYPRLIANSHPEYIQVEELERMTANSYFMFSGCGMPALYQAIGPALEDISAFNREHDRKIEEFVICLDTDYYGNEEETFFRIMQEVQKCSLEEVNVSVVLQTMCIESWFLGNQEAFPEEYSQEFITYVEHYNVSVKDPEKMPLPKGAVSIGNYSKRYLKKMLNETGRTYSASKVQDVVTAEYIAGMDRRWTQTGHIQSYHYFQDFLKRL